MKMCYWQSMKMCCNLMQIKTFFTSISPMFNQVIFGYPSAEVQHEYLD